MTKKSTSKKKKNQKKKKSGRKNLALLRICGPLDHTKDKKYTSSTYFITNGAIFPKHGTFYISWTRGVCGRCPFSKARTEIPRESLVKRKKGGFKINGVADDPKIAEN